MPKVGKNIPQDRNYSRFSYKKIIISTLFGEMRFRFSVIIFPATLKTRSAGADVATNANSLHAISLSFGNVAMRSRHHTRGSKFSASSGVGTPSAKKFLISLSISFPSVLDRLAYLAANIMLKLEGAPCKLLIPKQWQIQSI